MLLGFEGSVAEITAKKFANITNKLICSDNNKHSSDATSNCSHDIGRCISLNRIISLLKVYSNNYQNHEKMEQYVVKYKNYLVEDYHHILDKHLNEDRISNVQCNKHFEIIYNKITEVSNIQCDITTCRIYSRNNRQREIMNIDDVHDRKLGVFIDIIDTIHCYFLHSVDIGYRFIQPQRLNPDDDEEEKTNHHNGYDPKMRYLNETRENLEKLRGHRRVRNSKFLTHISSWEYIMLSVVRYQC